MSEHAEQARALYARARATWNSVGHQLPRPEGVPTSDAEHESAELLARSAVTLRELEMLTLNLTTDLATLRQGVARTRDSENTYVQEVNQAICKAVDARTSDDVTSLDALVRELEERVDEYGAWATAHEDRFAELRAAMAEEPSEL